MKVVLYFFLMCLTLQLNGQDGSLDLTFDNDGYVLTDLDGNIDLPIDVLIQPDGKILVVGGTRGNSFPPDFDLALMRYNEDGSLDQDFGDNGITITDFGGDDQPGDIALDTDGNIYMAGHFLENNQRSTCVYKFLSNGNLDLNFGMGGYKSFPFAEGESVSSKIKMQSSGKIIIGGAVYNNSTSNWDLALLRIDEAGNLDITFGVDGRMVTDIELVEGIQENDGMREILVLSNDKFFVSGTSGKKGAVTKYNADGSLDTSFGNTGSVGIEWGIDMVNDIAGLQVRENGKIVISGNVRDDNFTHDNTLAQLNEDGTLDTEFAGGGKMIYLLGDENVFSAGMVLEADGKIVVGGQIDVGTPSISTTYLARFTAEGMIDNTFGTNGLSIQGFGLGYSAFQGLVLQPDGKIVAIGAANEISESDIIVVRFGAGTVATKNLMLPELGASVAPNPFSKSFVLNFSLEKSDWISIYLYDINGQQVKVISSDMNLSKGSHTEIINVVDELADGMYFLKIMGSSGEQQIKVQLMK